MIQISGGAMHYGGKVLFTDLDWLLTPEDRIGIVGSNGSGKTTLLRILSGTESLEAGRLTRQKNLRVGYLPQDGLSFAGRTLWEECLSVFEEALSLEQEQEELAHRMGELDPAGEEYRAVANRYQWVHDRYLALDGYSNEAQVGTVLGGLGFPKQDWLRQTETFSGGWQMRVALAKLLLEKPNLLLLDEPTNHLDLEARNWLEDYLQSYPYAFVVISHDRYFLDMTVKKIIEIWNKKVHFYPGSYSRYEAAKQQRLEQLQAAHKNQQGHIRHLEKFISRFRYKATKAAQVQSRIKELEKIERIELPEEEETIHFKFPQPPASGRVVMELEQVAKDYNSHHVFENLDLMIERGDRIALIGPNGAGKSTLIRILAGIEPLTAGRCRSGHKVEVDYFAQDQYKTLDSSKSLWEDLTSLAPHWSDTQLRGLLGCFLFSGDDIYKRIGVLSGGERNRYALARVLIRPANLLLLDEPTNHLDMRAKEVLLQALLDFNGTVVFVSHDRYFIDRLATKIFEVGAGGVKVYPGNYEDYLWRLEHGSESPEPFGGTEGNRVEETLDSEENGSRPPEKKRINPQQAELLQKQVSELESEIERLEEEADTLQQQLTQSFKDPQESNEILVRIDEVRAKIKTREQQWGSLAEKLQAEA